MPRHRRTRRLTAALAACLVPAAVTAGPAAAAPEWFGGSSERTSVASCYSYVPTNGMDAKVWLQADPQAPTRVGDVFYARVTVTALGGTCIDQFADPEVILPAGVELAVSGQQPIRCFSEDIGTAARTEIGAAQGCGQAPPQGLRGLQLTNTTRPDGLWLLPAGKAIDIWFPLRSTRPLAGGVLLSPGCGRPATGNGQPPCPVEYAGDNLQVGVWVIDGQSDPWLAPQVGLQVAAAAGPAPTPGTTPSVGPSPARLLTAPAAMRIRSALRGIPVTVRVPAGRARVTAALSARSLGRLAVVRRNGVRAGTLRLRVKPTRAAARRLRRARTVTATLRVTVRVAGRPATTASSRVRLRR